MIVTMVEGLLVTNMMLVNDVVVQCELVSRRSSVGVDMLKTMGWKEGGGIGAKVNKQMDQVKGIHIAW